MTWKMPAGCAPMSEKSDIFSSGGRTRARCSFAKSAQSGTSVTSICSKSLTNSGVSPWTSPTRTKKTKYRDGALGPFFWSEARRLRLADIHLNLPSSTLLHSHAVDSKANGPKAGQFLDSVLGFRFGFSRKSKHPHRSYTRSFAGPSQHQRCRVRRTLSRALAFASPLARTVDRPARSRR